MNSILSFFIPKDKKFYPLFVEAGENLVIVSEILVEALSTNDLVKRKQLIDQVEKYEHLGDDITHRIFTELGKNFITPFDREDIMGITSAIDDVVDMIHGTAKRTYLYNLNIVPPPIIEISKVLLEMNVFLCNALKQIDNIRERSIINQAIIEINKGENKADDIYNTAVAELFRDGQDTLEIIKIKEVLYTIETATDKCEDAANVLESILLKNA